jgi:hypothetical protein
MTMTARLRALNIVLFALALLAQVLMPVAMARASALSSDASIHAIICGQSDAGQPSSGDGHGLAGHDQCPLCQSGGLHAAVVSVALESVLICYPTLIERDLPDIAPRAQPLWPNLHSPPTGPPTFV